MQANVESISFVPHDQWPRGTMPDSPNQVVDAETIFDSRDADQFVLLTPGLLSKYI